MGLVVPQHAGSSQTRDGTSVLCIARQILNQWTFRETFIFLKNIYLAVPVLVATRGIFSCSAHIL